MLSRYNKFLLKASFAQPLSHFSFSKDNKQQNSEEKAEKSEEKQEEDNEKRYTKEGHEKYQRKYLFLSVGMTLATTGTLFAFMYSRDFSDSHTRYKGMDTYRNFDILKLKRIRKIDDNLAP